MADVTVWESYGQCYVRVPRGAYARDRARHAIYDRRTLEGAFYVTPHNVGVVMVDFDNYTLTYAEA